LNHGPGQRAEGSLDPLRPLWLSRINSPLRITLQLRLGTGSRGGDRGRGKWTLEWKADPSRDGDGLQASSTTTTHRTRRVGMNRSGRGCRCVVVVQTGVACGQRLAVRPSGGEASPIHGAAERAKAAADAARTPGRSRANRRFRSRLPSQDRLVRSPLFRFSAAIPHPD